jgi:hypothetical protein
MLSHGSRYGSDGLVPLAIGLKLLVITIMSRRNGSGTALWRHGYKRPRAMPWFVACAGSSLALIGRSVVLVIAFRRL